jgi:PAS domain S-box-containing protein
MTGSLKVWFFQKSDQLRLYTEHQAVFSSVMNSPTPTAPPEQIMKRFIERNLASSGLGLALLLLVIVGGASYRSITRLLVADQWVKHTYIVLEEIDNVISGLKDAERGRRGYIITSDKTFLTTFELGGQTVKQEIKKLQQLTADNPRQQQRLDALQPLIAKRLASLQNSVKLRQQNPSNFSAQVTVTEQDKELQAQVQKILDEMEAEEQQLLQRRSLASEVSVRNTIIVFVVGYTLSFGLLVGVYWLLQRRIRERKQAEEEKTRLITSLQESDRKFRAIFNQTFQFIELLSVEGILLEANQTALDFGELQANQVIGRPFWECPWWPSSPETQEELKAAIVQAAADEFVRYEVDVIGAGDRVATIDFSIKPVKHEKGRVVLLICEGRDITLRKKAEAVICELNAELEERVEERTAQLEAANQQLQESYNLLQTVIDSNPNPIFVKDCQGRYLFMNSPGADLFNKSVEEIIGQDDTVLFPPEVCAEIKANDHRIITSGNYEILEETVLVEGEWRTYSTTKNACRDSQGNILGLVGFARDITPLKQTQEVLRQANEELELRVQARTVELSKAIAALSESEERLRLFIENVPSAIAMFDREMRYLATSQRWLLDYNLGEQEIIGRCHYDVLPEIPERWKEDNQSVLAGEVIKSEEDSFLRANGTTDWLRYALHPWHNSTGEVGGIIMFTEVITQRKEAEQKLKKAIAELARSNQELEQFAYVASHDLREPLRKIKSYTDLLVKRYQGQLDEKADKYIAYITDGAVRMQTLITDLLTYSRVGRGEIALEPTDLGAVLNRTLSDLSNVIRESNALITTDPLPTVKANPTQMGQLLQNLIANAIKFHGQQLPHVQIRAVLHDQSCTICVQDNGIGIEPQYAERIFVIFQRLHTKDEYPGTGIGLAVCKKIVERHGGQIWVESELGRGTTFCFTLPAG